MKTRYNPERRAFRGRSYRKCKRVRTLRERCQNSRWGYRAVPS